MINAVILPPMAWAPEFNAFVPDAAPDPFRIYSEMKQHGVNAVVSDPLPRPWNPFAGKSTLLESLDPIRSLKTVIQQRRADILISVFEGAAAPLAVMRSIGILRTPVCIWDPGLTEGWKLRQRMLDIAVPRVDAVMVLGRSQKPYIEGHWKLRGQVHVIHHHIDTEFFRPLPIAEDGFVLSVGDDIGRDFATLIHATQGLEQQVVIKASRNPPAIPSTASNVRLMRERISYGDLRDLYARSGVVVVPALETLNACGVSTILEASAMGRPLIVSDNPAIHDFIIPGETCIMVPRQDPQALRDAIVGLMKDANERARLGKNARQFALDRFSKPVFAKTFAQTLEKIISHANARRGQGGHRDNP